MPVPRPPRRTLAVLAAGTLAAATLIPVSTAHAAGGLAGSDLFLNPYSTTLKAAQSLTGQARADAQLLGSIPSADWITQGSPTQAKAAVAKVVDAVKLSGAAPIGLQIDDLE